MPLINTNTNIIPSFREVRSSGGPPPTPTVNWQMVLEAVDPLNTFLCGGYQLDLTGPAGTNDIVAGTAGPADPGFIISSTSQQLIAFDFFGASFQIDASPQHVVTIEMTNTNIMPLGTSINGPTLVLTPPAGPNWNVDVYVRTLGYPAPGILTQQQAPADIVAYLIQL